MRLQPKCTACQSLLPYARKAATPHTSMPPCVLALSSMQSKSWPRPPNQSVTVIRKYGARVLEKHRFVACSMMSLACAIIDTPSAFRACSSWIRGCTLATPPWLHFLDAPPTALERAAFTAAAIALAPPSGALRERDERAWPSSRFSEVAWPSLHPCVMEAATVCNGGCNHRS